MEEEEENVLPEYPVEQNNINNTDDYYEPKKPLIYKEPESPETYAKKWFYTKSLFIIFIQFFVIALIFFVCKFGDYIKILLTKNIIRINYL